MERKICQRISIGTRTFNEGGADEEHLIAIHEVKRGDDGSARYVSTQLMLHTLFKFLI